MPPKPGMRERLSEGLQDGSFKIVGVENPVEVVALVLENHCGEAPDSFRGVLS